MIGSADSVSRSKELLADVCIVGAGAAGITLAHELNRAKASVILLEGGSRGATVESSSIYGAGAAASSRQSSYIRDSRLRYFGGTTNHWGGITHPLSPIDFLERSWMSGSGWPIEYSEVAPYYRRASEIIGIQPFDSSLISDIRTRSPIARALESDAFTCHTYQKKATRFGQEYGPEIKKSRNVLALLDANMTDLNVSRGRRMISSLSVKTFRKNEFIVKAKVYVLACGGMENARILLNSDQAFESGIGNHHGHVGRYFMEHLHGVLGYIALPFDAAQMRIFRQVSPTYLQVSPTDELLAANEILNFSILLEETDRKTLFEKGEIPDIEDLSRSIVEPAGEAEIPTAGTSLYKLHYILENAPHPDNRLRLSAETDFFGKRRILLDFELQEQDVESHAKAFRLLASDFGKRGLGRVNFFGRSALAIDRMGFGGHHIGTTRASSSPRDGVVDGNLKLHGLENLYVLGSSVFRTGGAANPTLTIVALTVRLGDHLKRRFRLGSSQ